MTKRPVAKPSPRPPAARPPAGAEPLKLGIIANTIGWGQHAGDEQDRVRPLGVRWLREELDWDSIEPQPGVWNWADADAMFAAAARRGFQVLPLLAGVPKWTGADDTYELPADPAGFAGFVGQVVARYGHGGSFWAAHPEIPADPATTWEIWNEPYVPPFSDGVASPSLYARLFKAAAIAGHRADQQAKFLIEADTSATSDWHEYHPWVDAMYAAVPDLGNYFDGVAVHPYGQLGPDYYTPGSSRWQVRRLEEVHAQFAAHGDGSKHLWATEVGWTTCPGGSDGCVSEQQQASYLQRFLQLAQTTWRPYLDAVFVYSYREYEQSATNPEDWYGLTRANGSDKPAWNVYRSFAAGS